MSFCYICPDGHRIESPQRADRPLCVECGVPSRRDYHAEGVGLGTGVKVSRDGTMKDQADLFLPTNRELAGPGDPDGTKGMREWRERVTPKESKPYWPGAVDRKTF